MPKASRNTGTRATLVNAPGRYRPDIDRWAIIVGISQYHHKDLNLRWAHRDAEELYKLLLTPAGGCFAADHIQLLVNEAATNQAITRALRSFLKKPAKDDVVLIYLACHGGPDPDRPKNLYLLAHDTDPNDIAATALPMREINLSLQENLLAERVVILADTCHSAGIDRGIDRRSRTADAGVINAYLDEMSKVRGGVALLTSAEARETSQEDARWGGGHGVFTHYLLEGLSGAADGFRQPRDGKVTIGELFDYVRHHVQQATGNSQHPSIGSSPFDRNLPLAITGHSDAEEYMELGKCLYELACIADEPDRYRAAARHFEEALHLASLGGVVLPEAQWRLAQAWLASGDTSGAVDILTRLAQRQTDAIPPAALFTLGLAQAAQGDIDVSIASLRRYLELYPDSDHASWGRYCLALLEQAIVPRAIVIGIGKYAPDSIQFESTGRPTNDVELFKSVLTSNYGFADCNVTVLLDEHATWVAIKKALIKLAERTHCMDPVVVYLSGVGFQGMNPDGRNNAGVSNHDRTGLVTYDGIQANVFELHERLLAIPSVYKVLIVDGMPANQMIELAQQAGEYTLLLAAEPGQHALEINLDTKPDGTAVRHGRFTLKLAQAARALAKESATLGDLHDQARELMEKGDIERPQTPVLAGNRDQPVFRSSATTRSIHLFSLLSATEQWAHHAETPEELSKAYDRFLAFEVVPYAQAHLSYGRAFTAHNSMDQAIAALKTSVSQVNQNRQCLLALGKAQAADRQYSAALDTFRRLPAESSTSLSTHIQTLLTQAGNLVNLQYHAVIVGIDRYASDLIPPLDGAVNDARAIGYALAQRLGFQTDNIVLLLNEEATLERVVAEFRNLTRMAENEPAFFYFAGYARFEIEEGAPLAFRTLVCADSHTEEMKNLRLEELASTANAAKHLVTIIDASTGYPPDEQLKTDQHVNKRQLPTIHVAKAPANRSFGVVAAVEPTQEDLVPVGGISVYSSSGEMRMPTPLESEREAQVHGVLTYLLLKALEENDLDTLTYRSWVEAAGHREPELSKPAPVQKGSIDEQLFDPRLQREEVLVTATRIELDIVYRSIELLKRQVAERRQQDTAHPDAWLSLGVAYGVLGDYPLALEALEAGAASIASSKTKMNQTAAYDANLEQITSEISYHVGRLLLASQREYGRAVSELRQVTQQDPCNARAFYYLGQAVREMIHHETLAVAEEAFGAYLAKGAPAGHYREVAEFLSQR